MSLFPDLRQTDKQERLKKEGQPDNKSGRQTDRETERQRDRQIDR